MRRIFEEYAREYRARKGAHSEYLPPRKNNHVEKEEERITIILDIYIRYIERLYNLLSDSNIRIFLQI